MWRVAAAALALLLLSASAARAEDFAADLVTAFCLICLSNKPYKETLKAAAAGGQLHETVLFHSGGLLSTRHTRSVPKGYRVMDRGTKKLPELTGGFREGHVSGRSPCYVATRGKIDCTGVPLADQPHELAKPAEVLAADEIRRFGRFAPKSTDPAWHVLGSRGSIAVLYKATGTYLLRIEPPTD